MKKSMNMIKYTAFIGCLLLLSQTATAQLYPLQEINDSLGMSVTVENHQLKLRFPENSSLFKARGNYPQITAVRLEEADLALEYIPGKTSDGRLFEIIMTLQMSDGTVVTPRPDEILDQASVENKRVKIWPGAAEYLMALEQVYLLRVKRVQMGAVDCEGVRPAFTLKKRLPYYAAAGGGLVLIGLGQVYYSQQKDYYRTYRRLWTDGAPEPANGDNPRQKAIDKNKAFQICTWTGIGILAVDALLFVNKRIKINKKQKTYDEFCAPAIRVQPGRIGLLMNF